MSTATKPKISCAPDGPYLVRGPARLRNSKGEDLPARESMALCRCGGSRNKPFCDGTHAKIGFASRRSREDPPTHGQDRYEGKDVTILDNRTVCAHAGFCTDGLPGVWRMKQEPWIDPDAADRESVLAIVKRCPSGALGYEIDGREPLVEEVEPAITVTKDGPYAVVGGLVLDDPANGQTPQASGRYTLCRCGQSKNKPFCDGAHWYAEFRDEKN